MTLFSNPPYVKINFEYNYFLTQENYIFWARYFTPKDIELIKDIIQTYGAKGRSKISQVICEELNWRQVNGRLKDVACREALRKMAYRGIYTIFWEKLSNYFFITD
jgi:hypothetical protein